MPDDEFPCLCLANGLPPSGHKAGERCPAWDILLYGNAYGWITERDAKGNAAKMTWLDPREVIIKWKEPVTMRPVTDRDDSPAPKPPDTRLKRLVRYVLDPGRLFMGLIVTFCLTWFNTHHHVTQATFWTTFAVWPVSMVTTFFLREAYLWAKK